MGIRCLQTKYLELRRHSLHVCGLNEEHGAYLWKQSSLGDDRAAQEDVGGPAGRQQWPGH